MLKLFRPRTNGINAITINEGDQLLEAKLTSGQNEIIIANKEGRAIRFNETKVRPMGRGAAGVKSMTLGSNKDEVIGMISADPTKAEYSVFVVSEKVMVNDHLWKIIESQTEAVKV